MNVEKSVIVLRTRTVGEVIDLACRFLMEFAGTYARLALFALLPPFAGLVALRYTVGLDWRAIWLIALAVCILLEAPFTLLSSRLVFSEQLTVGSALRLTWKRLGPYLGLLLVRLIIGLPLGSIAITLLAAALGRNESSGQAVLEKLLLALCSMIALVPAAFVVSFHFFVPEATVLEGFGVGGAFTRANRLRGSRKMPVFALVLLLWLARAFVMLLADVLGNGICTYVLQLDEPLGSVLHGPGSVFALAGLFLTTPFAATCRFLAYIDTRTRSDAWDIQVKYIAMVAKLGGSA